jgi:hypothetical protein
MATEIMQNWGSRSKKTSVIALGLVAILAGIAVAYFLTSREYAGNQAVGGSLTVDATLPIDFSDEPLYPTNSTGTDDFAEKEFTITNNNTVPATYQLFATCEECITDPADTPEQAAARADKVDQFNNLYIKITTAGTAGTVPGVPVGSQPEVVHYNGKLADLSPTSPASLGNVNDGDEHTYTVRLWLANDASRAQPQAVQNLWEFFVNAKTPA